MTRRLALLFSALLLLAGCVIPKMRPAVNSMDDLGDGQAVVVGKLVMDPPFGDKEKDMNEGHSIVIGTDRWKDNLWVLVGPGKFKGEGEPENSDIAGAIETPWNTTFYSRFDAQKNVLQMVAVAMTLSQKAYYPLNLQLDVRREDEVVYIGTIMLKRDDYNNPAGMSVRDDSESAAGAIRKKFGNKVKIRKALAKAL